MRPMLASAIKDIDTLDYPVLASPKLDGIRALAKDGMLYSRSMKPIRNKYIQHWFSCSGLPTGLDGELIVGDEKSPDCFNTSTSGVMSVHGEPDFTFFVFDSFLNPSSPFVKRFKSLPMQSSRLQIVHNTLCTTKESLEEIATLHIEQGYEGTMVRKPNGIYKFGRSTEKEGYLLKLKPFADMEGEVIGYSELLHNNNEAQVNEVGNLQRSMSKANMSAGDTLGALIIKSKGFDTFSLGTGFSAAQRASLWLDRDELVGKMVKFKYQTIGSKDRPRLPVFLGFRDRDDL